MLRLLITVLLLAAATVDGASKKIETLYNSLDTRSISQHLAFYNLYETHPLGLRALEDAWRLMGSTNSGALPLKNDVINAIVAMVNKRAEVATPELDENAIAAIESVAGSLSNRLLKGHSVESEEELLSLSPEDVDLCRGLLLTEMGSGKDAMKKIRSYEAMIDLMALQIAARLPEGASAEEKITAINRFVFEEQGYRFPPHSLYAKEIDEYTFLPAVLDSRRGVCLGVSILYICFAQRLDLDLEMITPPGHIYVRHRSGDKIINIETTARGIDMETEAYLGVAVKKLQERNVKEVIGLAHFNKGSGFWQQKEYENALSAYSKAALFLPEDLLLKELTAYIHFSLGHIDEGRSLLERVVGIDSEFTISDKKLAEDLLKGNVDLDGLEAIMMPVDETRSSILEKCSHLQKALDRCPRFRDGIFYLAVTWLQLHRPKEAVAVLDRYCTIVPDDPTAHYYLSVLHYERLDDKRAWEHLRCAENTVAAAGHSTKALKQLRKALSRRCPQ